MKKLSHSVQNLMGALSHVRTFKTAIEELVYNSLDADSTSIAVRVDILENLIQVIDNGHGIPHCDFSLLGQKHTTSKYVDLTTLKSSPCKYGFRGQALASIIEVSKHMTITSRCEQSEETWVKHFYQGKSKDISLGARRPSKGTTVDVRGFLFNLKIQKKAVDPLKELCDIKTFLEQISLVHSNISLSLRDNAKNEIVFQIHKKRELLQTLTILYGIKKDDLQELHVEKNKYKVTAYIEKLDKELKIQKWIYLNGKFISDSKLHKIVNRLFSRRIKSISCKVKNVQGNDEDKEVFKKKVPFYILFINCPYYDYDINFTEKETNIEFKSWDNIKNLLEKLIKFYDGDVKLKPLTAVTNKSKVQQNTRDEVKKMMNKILGSHSKKNPQMQNGIKGRLIKRKTKKKLFNISKPTVNKKTTEITESKETCDTMLVRKPAFTNHNEPTNLTYLTKPRSDSNQVSTGINNNNESYNYHKTRKENKNKKTFPKINKIKQSKNKLSNKKTKKNKHLFTKDPVIERFKIEDDLIKRNCNILAKKVEKALHRKNQGKQIFVNETVQYNNIVRNNKNISVRQQIEEIVIHEYFPRNRNKASKSNIDAGKIHDNLKTNYDLVHTVLTQHNNYRNLNMNKDNWCVNNRQLKTPEFHINNIAETQNASELKQTNDVFVPQLTYESHKYQPASSHNQENIIESETPQKNKFISKMSVDNFKNPGNNLKIRLKNKLYSTKKRDPYFRKQKFFNTKFDNQDMTVASYEIDFSQQIENNVVEIVKSQVDLESCKQFQTRNTIDAYDNTKDIPYSISSIVTNTYTLTSSIMNDYGAHIFERCNLVTGHDDHYKTYTLFEEYDKNQQLDQCYNNFDPKNDLDVIFLSKSQNENVEANNSIEPLDICATVLDTSDIFDEEFRQSFNDDNIQNDSLLNVQTNYNDNNNIDSISHHFNTWKHTNESEVRKIDNINNESDVREEVSEIIKPILQSTFLKNIENRNYTIFGNFNFKNRPRFLPKGMSPIFKNCQTKTANENFIDEECFSDKIYDNFANEVQTHSDIFRFGAQNVTDVTTKAIEKVNTRMHKANASLIFNGASLKNLQVMGQVDDKFIAAKIKGKSHEFIDATEFLVLFDQHALHERIRLEINMAEYFKKDKWQSVEVDDVLLKLSKDQILYLHNHREKFIQFGLQWTILNSEEVVINSIPKAVIGKNPRQVEKIIKAVKNLIAEEIETINNQKGCITLFPKAIMDLVFSEACRYAIKFGDRLSIDNCIELLQELSQCKTPFQCAHGRPVMAVIMEIQSKENDYKIDVNKLRAFIKN